MKLARIINMGTTTGNHGHVSWTSRLIDGRNQLFGVMAYQVKCSLPWFFEAREWCWDQWGPGIEYEHYHNYNAHTGAEMPWAWDCSKYQGASISSGRIYLRDEEQMGLFSLRWSDHQG